MTGGNAEVPSAYSTPVLTLFHPTYLSLIDDLAKAITIPGLVIYRYDAPLCFANGENFKKRSREAIKAEANPVEWFVLNMEANVEIYITAINILKELRRKLTARGIILGCWFSTISE